MANLSNICFCRKNRTAGAFSESLIHPALLSHSSPCPVLSSPSVVERNGGRRCSWFPCAVYWDRCLLGLCLQMCRFLRDFYSLNVVNRRRQGKSAFCCGVKFAWVSSSWFPDSSPPTYPPTIVSWTESLNQKLV